MYISEIFRMIRMFCSPITSTEGCVGLHVCSLANGAIAV